MEFLIIVYNWHLPRHWKRHQSWRGFVFIVLDRVAFLDHQFLVAWLFHQLAMYCVTSSSITTSTCVVRLQAAFLLVVHVISMLEVVELALLMNIS